MLWDTLHIEKSKVCVVKNTDIAKIQKILLFVIPVVCTVICYAIITNIDTVWKYFSIPFCILIFLLYKFYYLPSQDSGDVILSVGHDKIVYVEPDVKYIIPILSIENAKDESVYFDLRGRRCDDRNSIVIEIKAQCSITKETPDGKKSVIYSLASNPMAITIDYLQLERNDHKKLYKYLQEVIAIHKEN